MLRSTKLRGQAALDASIFMHDPKMSKIVTFLAVMSFAMMASTSGNYMSVVLKFFEEKFEWDTT